MKDRGPFTQTFTGRRWHAFSPRSEDVCIEDLAHHLAINARWSGASRVPYSIAEHCVRCARHLAQRLAAWDYRPLPCARLALAALLHDAPEAYTGDHLAPYKRRPEYSDIRRIEHAAHAAINAWAGLDLYAHENEQVRDVDRVLTATERRDLLVPMAWEPEPQDTPLVDVIEPWDWMRAEREFRAAFEQYASAAALPKGATHYHSCPRCYASNPCGDACTVHMDDDLVPQGCITEAHCSCSGLRCPCRTKE